MSTRSLFGYLRFLKKAKRDVVIAIVMGIIHGLSSGFGVPVILKYSSSLLFSGKEVDGITLTILTLLPMIVMFTRGILDF